MHFIWELSPLPAGERERPRSRRQVCAALASLPRLAHLVLVLLFPLLLEHPLGWGGH